MANQKTTYCMSCGKDTKALFESISGWYCRACSAELKRKGIANA